MDLEGEARRAGVADRVHVMGFVPFEDFEAAIAAVDLCLNLRYPTAGETSASLLRVLAAGRPAIVSDFAQFADLPAEIALRVPLGDEEPEALAALLRELLADPGRLRAMGGAAREHVRVRHDPARAAAGGGRRLPRVGRAAAAGRRSAGLPRRPGPLQPRLGQAGRRAGGRGRRAALARGGAAAAAHPPAQHRLRPLARRRARAGRRGRGGEALRGRGEDLLEGRPWLALPHDLAPGEEVRFETDVRRPPGPGPSLDRAPSLRRPRPLQARRPAMGGMDLRAEPPRSRGLGRAGPPPPADADRRRAARPRQAPAAGRRGHLRHAGVEPRPRLRPHLHPAGLRPLRRRSGGCRRRG